MLLAGDIGGTKTDLAVYSAEQGARKPLVQAEYPSQDFKTLAEMVAAFRKQHEVEFDTACFDVAGPVTDGSAKLTNLPWLLDEASLARDLGVSRIHLLNDLEAVAYAVPHLTPDELITINPGVASDGGAIAVVAPGTGLGEAFLTRDDDSYRAHASEGGHADFAPTNALQVELLTYLLPKFDHVSYERVCSGIGLPNIYDFLRQSGHGSESPAVATKLASAEAAARAHVIIDCAFDPNTPDPLSLATLDMFTSILAAEAGNLALKVLATGGIYLAGGIATHVVPKLQPAFEASFGHKGRFAERLMRIPVYVITAQAALLGAAIYGLGQPSK